MRKIDKDFTRKLNFRDMKLPFKIIVIYKVEKKTVSA